jgi:hypothetical protein
MADAVTRERDQYVIEILRDTGRLVLLEDGNHVFSVRGKRADVGGQIDGKAALPKRLLHVLKNVPEIPSPNPVRMRTVLKGVPALAAIGPAQVVFVVSAHLVQ